MIDNNVKLDKPVWLSEKDELVITESIAKIVKEDRLKIYEYNICRDHMHILLACENEEELTAIVGKLKAVSGRACNIVRGITVPAANTETTTNTIDAQTRGPVPLAQRGPVPLAQRGPVPLAQRGPIPLTDPDPVPKKKKKKKYNPFWTQKFDRREITDEYYLRNVIAYIKNNREKHKLPANNRIRALAEEMCRACDG